MSSTRFFHPLASPTVPIERINESILNLISPYNPYLQPTYIQFLSREGFFSLNVQVNLWCCSPTSLISTLTPENLQKKIFIGGNRKYNLTVIFQIYGLVILHESLISYRYFTTEIFSAVDFVKTVLSIQLNVIIRYNIVQVRVYL